MKHICLAVYCFMFVFGARAQNSGAAQPLPKFALSQSDENPRYWIALNSSRRYAFLAPPNWIASRDYSQRAIRFQDNDNGSVLTVRFKDEAVNPVTKEDTRKWLQDLLAKFPGARLQQKSEMAALSQKAVVLDLAWTSADSTRRAGRFARVPIASGSLELSLLASAGKDFEAAVPAFTQLLLSLQAGSSSQRLALQQMPVE